MAQITLAPENLEEARKIILEAFGAGERRVTGSYSDLGFLFKILEALEVDFEM